MMFALGGGLETGTFLELDNPRGDERRGRASARGPGQVPRRRMGLHLL